MGPANPSRRGTAGVATHADGSLPPHGIFGTLLFDEKARLNFLFPLIFLYSDYCSGRPHRGTQKQAGVKKAIIESKE